MYIFNENGVCVNPELVQNYNKAGTIGYTIKVAVKDGRWCTGCKIKLRGACSELPTSFRYGWRKTRYDAIMDMLKYLLEYSQENSGRGDEDNEDSASLIPMIKRHIAKLNSDTYASRQLELEFK